MKNPQFRELLYSIFAQSLLSWLGGRAGLFVVGDFLNFARLQTGGADVNLFDGTVNVGAHPLKIWIPAPSRRNVRVGNRVAENRLLTAYFAYLSHCLFSKHKKSYYNQRPQKNQEHICPFYCLYRGKTRKIALCSLKMGRVYFP
jgi:hypothetical protein